MFDKRCRTGVERSLRPVGSGLGKLGITANQLTATGVVISVFAGLAIGRGWLLVGAGLLAASAIPDLLDGAVAKASGTSSPRGAFFDSVSDRVSDTVVLGGVAWYLASTHGSHAALLPFAVLGASNLVSYERARAESLGFSARGGLMERAERMMFVGVGLLFSRFLVPILWLMLALTAVTAIHRFVMVWRQGSTPRRPAGDRLLRSWRGWRPGEGFELRRSETRARWR
ncbi:MAG: CDP-alcohol phosphatidyltransferase family protein, partial [Actinobacteria bacterium]|nr:CDP-alcohol phosphatidyltransferase family protein [Actinomycetota bacterium]